jgi:CheY-like chemotaxis protein
MSSPERRHVLIIDDNADAADLLRTVLLSLGCEVALAYGGRAGIALARACRPGLVLCDLDMPGTNGYAVAATLRADPATACVPLVALTGWNDKATRCASLAAGFDCHIVRPIAWGQLSALLDDCFGCAGEAWMVWKRRAVPAWLGAVADAMGPHAGA